MCYVFFVSVCGGGGHEEVLVRGTGMCEPPTFANNSSSSQRSVGRRRQLQLVLMFMVIHTLNATVCDTEQGPTSSNHLSPATATFGHMLRQVYVF